SASEIHLRLRQLFPGLTHRFSGRGASRKGGAFVVVGVPWQPPRNWKSAAAWGWRHGLTVTMRLMPSRLAAIFLTAAAALSAQPLADAVRARIGDYPGPVGIYARNLDTGA